MLNGNRARREAFRGAGSRGARTLRGDKQRREHGAIDHGAAIRPRIESRVHVPVLAVGGGAERFRIGEIADDRLAAALGDAARFVLVAHQRGHDVTAAHQCIENGGADVSCGASQKDPHRGRIS